MSVEHDIRALEEALRDTCLTSRDRARIHARLAMFYAHRHDEGFDRIHDAISDLASETQEAAKRLSAKFDSLTGEIDDLPKDPLRKLASKRVELAIALLDQVSTGMQSVILDSPRHFPNAVAGGLPRGREE